MTTAADVERLDRAYLDLVAEYRTVGPPVWDAAGRVRRDELGDLVARAGAALADAITDRDLALYGDLLPED